MNTEKKCSPQTKALIRYLINWHNPPQSLQRVKRFSWDADHQDPYGIAPPCFKGTFIVAEPDYQDFMPEVWKWTHIFGTGTAPFGMDFSFCSLLSWVEESRQVTPEEMVLWMQEVFHSSWRVCELPKNTPPIREDEIDNALGADIHPIHTVKADMDETYNNFSPDFCFGELIIRIKWRTITGERGEYSLLEFRGCGPYVLSDDHYETVEDHFRYPDYKALPLDCHNESPS